MSMDDFLNALEADIILPEIAEEGPLSVTDVLATLGWYERYQQKEQ